MRVLSGAQSRALSIIERITLLLFPFIASFFVFAQVTWAGHTWAGQVNGNIVWIDVRPQREYRRRDIEGTINIPHDDIGHKIFVELLGTFK